MPDVFMPPTPDDVPSAVHRLQRARARPPAPSGRVPHLTADPDPDSGVSLWVRDDTGQLCYTAGGVTHRLGP